ncbi:hypothetical protein D8Y20_10785 [Mariprofundus sp. EBB-1]|uniref:tetratricopeptide repeat protein n=1 Tax=Mariprofundus sp. EBB-1 TaxID=2650971 RepID=UPI000EF1D585|nr:hypothetical protein [Mariprofundus sp. EBB-1]RLL50868.1 hypothetical protein D8Y20_10785 [Mariprofundus sp. EBB-1]
MKKIILATSLCLMMTGLAHASSLDSSAHHNKAAERYVAQKQFTKALTEYDIAIKKDKKSAQAWLGKAQIQLQLKQYSALKGTLEELDDVSNSKAEKFEFLLVEGQYYLAAKPNHWLSKLKQNFFKARNMDTSRSDLYLLMARASVAGGKERSARLNYNKVIERGGPLAAVASQELASIFRQAQASGTGKGWVGDLADRATIDRATLAAVLVDDIEVQQLFDKRSRTIALPSDCKGNTYSAAIDTLLNIQITSVAPDTKGLFNPNANVSRFELAKLVEEILIAYTKKEELSHAFMGTKSPFPDLNANHYAYNAAFLSISRGLMATDDLVEGNFSGDKAISGTDLLLVLRKLGSLERQQ